MNTNIDMSPETWTDWSAAHPDATDDIKLAALRNYIELAARDAVNDGEITAAWANKKLGPLGVTERIGQGNVYTLEAPVTATVALQIVAADRASAAIEFARQAARDRLIVVKAKLTGDVVFTDGPEDPSPAVADDAPTTVDATLVALREAILLAVVAGPRICESGANRVLANFGLGAVPERTEYVVCRPATGTMRTVVTAYDEVSAQRVAEWRWEDNRKGYILTETDEAGDYAVDVN